MRRTYTLVVAVMLLAVPLLAADLGKYTGWNESPQGYFMTSAERTQWAALHSEGDAEKFVAEFLARRAPGFAAEVASRAEKADKYLTVGKTPGSKSLRGKVVILLGPPSSMGVAEKKRRAGGRTGSMDVASSAGSERTGVGLADVAEVEQRDGMSGSTGLKNYTLTYGAEQLPTNKGMSIVIEVNAASGKDKLAEKRAAAEVENLLEAVAQATIVK